MALATESLTISPLLGVLVKKLARAWDEAARFHSSLQEPGVVARKCSLTAVPRRGGGGDEDLHVAPGIQDEYLPIDK